MLRRAGLLLLLFGLVLLSTFVLAEVPHLINYQGYLLSSGGVPITGPHNLTFQIYGDSLASDPVYWQELHVAVPVDAGLFHVVLGVTTPLADTVFVSAERWLGVTVDEDPEIAPRVRMTAVPWALKAAVADTALHNPPLPAHDHDDLYYRETELNAPGTINEPTNPVDWTKLKSVPAGFADGVDNTGGGGGGWVDDGTVVRLETATDKVGIGTTSPDTRLHIYGSDDPLVKLDAPAGAQSILGFATSDSVKWGWFIPGGGKNLGLYHWPSPAGRYMEFDGANGNIYLAHWANSGNVGIGTVSPGAKLTVENPKTSGAAIYGVASAGSGSAAAVSGLANSSTAFAAYFVGGRNYFGGDVGIGWMEDPAAQLEVGDDQSYRPVIYAHTNGTGAAAVTAEIQTSGVAVDAVCNSGTAAGSIAVRGRAQSDQYAGYFEGGKSYFSGNVGIGTASPVYKLDVVGHVNIEGILAQDPSLIVRNPWLSGVAIQAMGGGTTGHSMTGAPGVLAIGLENALVARCAGPLTAPGEAAVVGIISTNAFARLCALDGGTTYRVLGNGACSQVFLTSRGNKSLVSLESPEAWVEDCGSGEIRGGTCRVDLDPLLLECVTIDNENPVKVFVQPTSPLEQQYYVKKGTTGFDVIVLGEKAGSVSATFDYRIMCKGKGQEKIRFKSVD